MRTTLDLKIEDDRGIVADRTITFNDESLKPIPGNGDEIVLSVGEKLFYGRVVSKTFDYAGIRSDSHDDAEIVITVWADIVRKT
jgi:hypothetical protein